MNLDGYFTIELPGVGIVECPYVNAKNREIAPKRESTGGWRGVQRPELRVFAIPRSLVGECSPKRGGRNPYRIYREYSGAKVEKMLLLMVEKKECRDGGIAMDDLEWDSGHETGHHDKARNAWKHPLCVGERRTKTAIVIGRVIRKTGEGWSHPMKRG